MKIKIHEALFITCTVVLCFIVVISRMNTDSLGKPVDQLMETLGKEDEVEEQRKEQKNKDFVYSFKNFPFYKLKDSLNDENKEKLALLGNDIPHYLKDKGVIIDEPLVCGDIYKFLTDYTNTVFPSRKYNCPIQVTESTIDGLLTAVRVHQGLESTQVALTWEEVARYIESRIMSEKETRSYEDLVNILRLPTCNCVAGDYAVLDEYNQSIKNFDETLVINAIRTDKWVTKEDLSEAIGRYEQKQE